MENKTNKNFNFEKIDNKNEWMAEIFKNEMMNVFKICSGYIYNKFLNEVFMTTFNKILSVFEKINSILENQYNFMTENYREFSKFMNLISQEVKKIKSCKTIINELERKNIS